MIKQQNKHFWFWWWFLPLCILNCCLLKLQYDHSSIKKRSLNAKNVNVLGNLGRALPTCSTLDYKNDYICFVKSMKCLNKQNKRLVSGLLRKTLNLRKCCSFLSDQPCLVDLLIHAWAKWLFSTLRVCSRWWTRRAAVKVGVASVRLCVWEMYAVFLS